MNKKYMKYLILLLAVIIMSALAGISGRKADKTDTKRAEKDSGNRMNSEIAEDSELSPKDTVIIDEKVQSEIEGVIKNYFDASKKVDKNLIEKEEKKDNSQAVKEINEKREGIEEYKNIKTYVRPGLEEDTYVTFTTYEMKFYNIKTLAPGMSVLYIAKDESGELTILNRAEDNELNEYINELSNEDELAGVILDVNTRLKQAMKKDKELTAFVKSLKDISVNGKSKEKDSKAEKTKGKEKSKTEKTKGKEKSKTGQK